MSVSQKIQEYLNKKLNEEKVMGQMTGEEYVAGFSKVTADFANFIKSVPNGMENGVWTNPKLLDNWNEFKKAVADVEALVKKYM